MDQRTALLIDGSNMFHTSSMLRFHIDYKKLLDQLNREYDVVRANYYTAMKPNTGQDDPLIKLVDYLSYNGWKVNTKMTKEYDNVNGHVIKGNMDVEMALDALSMSDHIDHVILGTGDGDFTYLVNLLQLKGIEVSAISTIKTSPPMIATSLRRAVDNFIDLEDIRDYIAREKT